jgi:hypothetical protein
MSRIYWQGKIENNIEFKIVENVWAKAYTVPHNIYACFLLKTEFYT